MSTPRSISAHVPRVFNQRYIQLHSSIYVSCGHRSPGGGEGRMAGRRRESNPQPADRRKRNRLPRRLGHPAPTEQGRPSFLCMYKIHAYQLLDTKQLVPSAVKEFYAYPFNKSSLIFPITPVTFLKSTIYPTTCVIQKAASPCRPPLGPDGGTRLTSALLSASGVSGGCRPCGGRRSR